MQAHLRKHAALRFVWYDYWCMPQRASAEEDDRTPVDRDEFQAMLSCIADLYLTTQVLILLDMTYMGRFWTLMEAWCAMQTTTPEGVRPCKTDAEKRYTIACIHNATDKLDRRALFLRRCST